jgi:hypothetical protein
VPQALQSITGIHDVLDAIAWPGRKTLMLVSAGLPMSRRPGSTTSLDAETERIARRAAAASDPFVDRALRETSASYLLAVRAEPSERDGKEHYIRVAVKQRGASLRYRRVVAIPRGDRH